MSYQVGPHCYATPADAGPASCAAFVPTSSLVNGYLITISCAGANADGTLNMSRSVVDTTGVNPPALNSFTLAIDNPPCVESEWFDAAAAIAGPVLGVVCMCWGLWRIAGYLGWGRGAE